LTQPLGCHIVATNRLRQGGRRWAMLVALGVMSITWMAVITVLACAQKLLPLKAAIDVPLGLAIIGLGIWIIMAPASVPGLVPPM
jgi:hypothetical protein